MREQDAQPMLETILEEMRDGFTSVNEHIERIEISLDRVAAVTYETRADVRDLKK